MMDGLLGPSRPTRRPTSTPSGDSELLTLMASQLAKLEAAQRVYR